jgi:glycosyltransferase involved in cell wall biosynthesis
MIKETLISVVIPVYNEEAIIEESLGIITKYLKSAGDKYVWEILIINDGSFDKTGVIADTLAKSNKLLRIIHHPANMNLGRALQTGFREAKGEIIVVLDLDLSYSVDHIGLLVQKQIETDADIVIASPYMKDGKVTAVPFTRAALSRIVNRFMQFAAQEKFHTFTGMVRAYKSEFIKNLNLKTKNYEINPEILYKAMILRARIIEIPAHLDWSFQNRAGKKRVSGMRMMQSFYSGLMAGFIFRPYMYFLTFGFILLLLSMYIIVWIFINTFQALPSIQVDPVYFDDRFSRAIGVVFQKRPHAFFVGGITLILAIQILSLGFISLQNKRYFEESFHINSSIYKTLKALGKIDTDDSKKVSPALKEELV